MKRFAGLALLLLASGASAGIVLEDAAEGLGPIKTAVYKKVEGKGQTFRMILLDDRIAYFPPIPMHLVCVLCRSLAKDDRAGVSLGAVEIVYGAVPKDSQIATDLKLADKFLADIVFARNDWSAGYKLAGGYVPRPDPAPGDLAVFMKLKGVRFNIDDDQLVLSGERFEDTLVPLVKEKTKEGGNLPDFGAIRAGKLSPQFAANATHVADNFDYYRKEPVIKQVYRYGEVAAFLRTLKENHVDLRRLADSIDAAGEKRPGPFVGLPLEKSWAAYLKKIQAENDYANWSGPPYDLYVARRGGTKR